MLFFLYVSMICVNDGRPLRGIIKCEEWGGRRKKEGRKKKEEGREINRGKNTGKNKRRPAKKVENGELLMSSE